MKITKEYLRTIIKEELGRLEEADISMTSTTVSSIGQLKLTPEEQIALTDIQKRTKNGEKYSEIKKGYVGKPNINISNIEKYLGLSQ